MPTDDEDDERPRARRRRDDDDDDDYEDPEDRRSRRRTSRGDATGGLIPYKNAKALASYYCGVFSLIPCLGGILGPIAVVLGFLGLAHSKKLPEAKGKAHAIVGIVLGGLVTLGHIAAVMAMVFGAVRRG